MFKNKYLLNITINNYCEFVLANLNFSKLIEKKYLNLSLYCFILCGELIETNNPIIQHISGGNFREARISQWTRLLTLLFFL